MERKSVIHQEHGSSFFLNQEFLKFLRKIIEVINTQMFACVIGNEQCYDHCNAFVTQDTR